MFIFKPFIAIPCALVVLTLVIARLIKGKGLEKDSPYGWEALDSELDFSILIIRRSAKLANWIAYNDIRYTYCSSVHGTKMGSFLNWIFCKNHTKYAYLIRTNQMEAYIKSLNNV